MDDLTTYREAACEAARRGAAVLEEWRPKFQVREKGRADLVTDADLGAQNAIHSFLQSRFPDHAFLGEEGPASKSRPGPGAPPTWIVDPLDGTTNYVHDCPLYCVSIGLEIAGEMVVGVVYEPSRQEMFHAAKGQGARLNDRSLKTSTTAQLDQALLATGFPPDVRGQEQTLDWWRWFSFRTQSLRRTGSTAINLVWDVAGGMVILREAGGLLTNTDGSTYDPYTGDALGSNGPLHPILMEAMRQDPQQE
jgi:myo-inositol-1(or 4)-monophosphatase